MYLNLHKTGEHAVNCINDQAGSILLQRQYWTNTESRPCYHFSKRSQEVFGCENSCDRLYRLPLQSGF